MSVAAESSAADQDSDEGTIAQSGNDRYSIDICKERIKNIWISAELLLPINNESSFKWMIYDAVTAPT